MKSFVATLICSIAMVGVTLGQGLSGEVVLDQEQYLPGESLIVKVRLTNFSGQTLQLGTDPTWLSFTVEDSRRLAVPKRGPVPVLGEFSLEATMTATKKVDLAPYFDLTASGRYTVTAVLMFPQWRQAIQTKPVSFDIIKGSSIWEQEFGVPGTGTEPNSLPEVRRYALVQTLHSKAIRLYFKLSDSRDGEIYKIYPLGHMVSFGKPEPQLDKFGNLHVLYQNSGHDFMYCLIRPDGLLLARETYEYTQTRPTLQPEKDGRISVVGGARKVSATDLPPPQSPTASLNAKPEQP